MKLRLKILLLAAVPLLVALAAITVAIYVQGIQLAQREKQVVENAWLASKEGELRHYVNLAYSAIAPLQAAADDDATRQRALDLLAQMEFGHDGYFFVYDLRGRNLMHPRQPELVGQELWELRDTKGQPVIQNLLAAARRGGQDGEAVHYLWEKPSTHQTEEKLGYVVVLERWGWMLGTGIYLDYVEQALERIDSAAQANIINMFTWVDGSAAVSILGVAACGLALNISDHRQSDAKLRLMARPLVRSQEDERARLSRELHDGISQVLVSIKLSLEAARERLRQTLPAEGRALAHIDTPLGGALDRLIPPSARSGAFRTTCAPPCSTTWACPPRWNTWAASSPSPARTGRRRWPCACAPPASRSSCPRPLPPPCSGSRRGPDNVIRHAGTRAPTWTRRIRRATCA